MQYDEARTAGPLATSGADAVPGKAERERGREGKGEKRPSTAGNFRQVIKRRTATDRRPTGSGPRQAGQADATGTGNLPRIPPPAPPEAPEALRRRSVFSGIQTGEDFSPITGTPSPWHRQPTGRRGSLHISSAGRLAKGKLSSFIFTPFLPQNHSPTIPHSQGIFGNP